MSKRHASEALEELTGIESPVSKRSRLGEATPSPDFELPPSRQERASGTVLAPQPPEQTVAPAPGRNRDGDIVEDDDEEKLPRVHKSIRQSAPTTGYDDLYLDTVNRNVLDFDFEKLCSVSLSNINVYACLVCGRYFQGRGTQSHAYFHALDEDHHVFINLESQRVYVLPEGYEVHSRALDDIKYVADPRYARGEVAQLDRPAVRAPENNEKYAAGGGGGGGGGGGRRAWTLSGAEYTPGFVGMNNIKENDYVNAVVQALAHVPPLRNFFLLEDFGANSELVRRFSTLVRKIWNPRAFRAHVSPHELLQEVALRSNKRFSLTRQADPVDFFSWFLNNLHLGLGGSRTKPGSSMIQRIFQGRLRVESQAITASVDDSETGDGRHRFEAAAEIKVDVVRFMLLTLDLPPPPLFQDELERNIIPQVPLSSVLAKYDGRRAQEHHAQRKRYRLLHPLPPFLVLHIKRFSQNKFVSERNPTIVTFDPREGLDVGPYVAPPDDPAAAGLEGWVPGQPIMYDLVANIVHEAVRTGDVDGVADSGEERKTWKAQVRDKAAGEWVSCQDLFVEKIQAELLYLGETYMQIWERRKIPGWKGKARA